MRVGAVLIIVAILAPAAALAQSQELSGLLSRGDASEAAGKLAEAEAAYLAALEVAQTDEEHAQVLSRLGEIRRRRGDRDGAFSAYRRALDLRGDGAWLSRCLSQLASLAHQVGEVEVARATYTRLLTDFAGIPGLASNATVGLARLERETGDLPAAIRRLEQLLTASEGSGNSYQARRMLVECLLEAEEFDRAIEIARGGAERTPERADLLLRSAAALMDANKLERAEEVCREVLTKQPEDEGAWRLLYQISSERGTVEQLEAELLHAAEGPHRTSALRRLAEILSWEGEDERAMGVYEQLLEAAPEDVELLYRVGSLAKDAGDLVRAEGYLARLLRLQPDHRSAGQLLGEVYVRQGKTQQAVESFKAAAGYQPDDPSSARALGLSLSAHSLYRQAIAVYESTRRELGDETLLAYEMGHAFVGLLDYEPATQEFLIALSEPSRTSSRLISYELERLAGDEIAAETVLGVLDSWAQRQRLGDDQLLALARAYLAAEQPDRGLATLRRLGRGAAVGILDLAGQQAAIAEDELAADLYELALARELAPEQRGSVALRLSKLRLSQGRWREALKLLEDNPVWLAEPTEAALLRAEVLLRFAREVPAARKAYTEVLATTRDGSLDARRASWGLADCLFAAGEWDRAEEAYRILAEGPQGGLVVEPPPAPPGHPAVVAPGLVLIPDQRDESRTSPEYAALRMAEISLRRGNLEQATARFKQMVQQYPASVYANDALERLAFIKSNLDGEGEAEADYLRALGLLERGDWDAAALLLEELCDQPAEPLADDALMLLAASWADRGESRHAVALYIQLADSFPESLLAPTALLNAAHLLVDSLSRIAEGGACLERITESYPEAAAADEARDLLELIVGN